MYYIYDFSELTPEEQAEAKRLEHNYFSYMQALSEKKAAAMRAGTDYTEIAEELLNLTLNDPSRKYLEEVEKRHFSVIADNMAAVYADAIERLPRLISRDINGILGLNDVEQKEKDTLLTPDAIRKRVRYCLTMHLEALRADPGQHEKLEDEIARQAHNAEDYIKDQVPGQMSLFDFSGGNTPAHHVSGKKNAESQGAVITLNNYIQFISNKKYQYALTSKPNEYAYIVDGGADLMRDIISESLDNPHDGRLNISDDNMEKLANNEAIKPIDTPLLSAFLTAAQLSIANKSEKHPYIMVYLPSFCRELGIRLKTLDPKTAEDLGLNVTTSDGSAVIVEDSNKNSNDFWKRLDAIQGYIGILKQNSPVRCIDIVRFDPDTQILYLDFPYFKFVIQEIEDDPETKIYTKKDHNLIYEKKNYITIIHSDINSAKNKTAALIAIEIIKKVFQRGNDPDARLPQNKKHNYSDKGIITTAINCAEIVDNIPDFKYRLDNMRSNQETREKIEKNILNQQNLALKKAFSGAYDLLREKTDLYEYFTDVEVTPIIPTMRTLNNKIIQVKHRGTNPKYEKGLQDQKKQKKKADRIKRTLNKGK